MKCLGLSLHDVLRLKKIGFDYFKKKPLHYIDFFFLVATLNGDVILSALN